MMNNDDMLLYNDYIAFFNSIYDLMLKDIPPEETPKNKKSHGLFKKETRPNESPNYALAKQKIEEFIKEKCDFDDILSFKSLWNFVQFVRYAEKTIFYKNIPENSLYVDSDLNEVSSRMFKISSDNYDIKFKLEKVKDDVNNKKYSIINIHVQRLYGKKMQNIFTIVDKDVDFQDISDLYLMNTLNIILYKEMMFEIRSIFSKLLREINKNE